MPIDPLAPSRSAFPSPKKLIETQEVHMATATRMIHGPEMRVYVDRRQFVGLTTKEIRRCLKRYLARRIHRTLEALYEPPAMA